MAIHSSGLLLGARNPGLMAEQIIVGSKGAEAPWLPWDTLPPLDRAADAATFDATEVVGADFLEMLDGYPECGDQEFTGLAPTSQHERQVAMLLNLALRGTSRVVRQTMTAAGRVHDTGKRVPGVAEDFHCGKLWTPEHREHRAAQHELEGEHRLSVLSRKPDTDPRLSLLATLVGRHHCRDLLTIRSPYVRWMVALLQEADKAQAILLDDRKYKSDRLESEGLSMEEMAKLERVIVQPFQTPHYFGIRPGRILNVALKYRNDRVRAMAN